MRTQAPSLPRHPGRTAGSRLAGVVLLGLLSMAATGQGREGAANSAGSASPTNAAARAAAAGAVVAVRDPTTAAALLAAGQGTAIGGAGPADEKAPVIDRALLDGVEDRAPVRGADQNYWEALAYNHLLIEAHKTSARAFAASARRDLTPAHLFEEPEKYRGQVVHIEGRLRRLRRFDAPRLAVKEGVPVVYEGWIFGDGYGSQPYCVLMAEIPAGVTVGEQLEYRVAFDGYFFKIYRYEAAGRHWYNAPLLIGRTLTLRAPLEQAPGPVGSASNAVLAGFLAVAGVTVLLAVGLSWWYRRGDRRVRSRLGMAGGARLLEPNFPAEPESREAEPNAKGRKLANGAPPAPDTG